MSTVVPTGGNVTPALALGWPPAAGVADELEDFALAVAVDVAEDADGPEADDDAAVL